MSNKDYNYEIEKFLAQYGDKPDSGVERICGNCFLYNADYWRCFHAEDGAIYDETEAGCWYHRTHTEQERLAAFAKKHCEEVYRQRLEEQRKNVTSNCAGCPFREMRDMLQKVIGLDVLAGYWDVKNNCSLRKSIEKLLAKTKEGK